jgi:hypothetical protein
VKFFVDDFKLKILPNFIFFRNLDSRIFLSKAILPVTEILSITVSGSKKRTPTQRSQHRAHTG